MGQSQDSAAGKSETTKTTPPSKSKKRKKNQTSAGTASFIVISSPGQPASVVDVSVSARAAPSVLEIASTELSTL
jgi:hypothetical protein